MFIVTTDPSPQQKRRHRPPDCSRLSGTRCRWPGLRVSRDRAQTYRLSIRRLTASSGSNFLARVFPSLSRLASAGQCRLFPMPYGVRVRFRRAAVTLGLEVPSRSKSGNADIARPPFEALKDPADALYVLYRRTP